MTKYLLIAVFALAALLSGIYIKHDRDRLIGDLNTATEQMARLNAEAESARLALVARDELDRRFFEEMTNAKNEIDSLRADLAAGTKRLLVRASCQKQVPVAGTSSVDDAADAELTAVAGQDYLRLREQIITTESQLAGLQEYVRQVVRVVK
ncbi:lysis protein [Pseudomonas sp. TH31]|uniref:lysis protein n=1 Tax=Pseudomonas sp. TH31 TaxID=2796396 RepID=UPI00191228CC|nr:lysis protein [Pseudomonas sp. TH31]MBK5417738.1 lysis protein [Pseudomonas sp. TH31]